MRSILILLIVLCSIGYVKADGISWAGIADTHYGGIPWTWEQGTNSSGGISNQLYYIQTNHVPNFWVHAGDIGEATVSGSSCLSTSNYIAFTNNTVVLTNPLYAVAGNHDVVNVNWSCWTNKWPRQIAWTNGNYIFIGIGSHLDITGLNSVMDTQDLDFMENVMTNAYPTWTNFIVMSHYSVLTNSTFGSISSGFGLERVTNLFNYYRVVLYMHGHQHSVDDSTNKILSTPTLHMMIPSLTRYLNNEGAYQIFTLTNTTLIWSRYRTDTGARVSSTTNTVPQYISVWPPASGTNYYVSKAGNDSNDGSSGSPFLTVQHAVNVAQAGDSVLVGAGTYSEDVTTARNGTNGSPITLNGQGAATLRSILILNPYHTLKNFTMSGRTNAFQGLVYLDRGASYCVISNNILDVNYATNVNALYWNTPSSAPFGNAGSNNLVANNLFEHAASCPVLTMFGDNNTVRGNRFIDSDTVDWLRVWGRTNTISGNTFSNCFESGASGNHADWLQTFGLNGYGGYANIIESNVVVASAGDAQLCMFEGQDCVDLRDYTFRNNVFVGVSAKGTMAVRDVKWYNNIFIDCSTNPITAGPVLIFTVETNVTYTNFVSNSGHGGQAYNNIFLNCGSGTALNQGWYSFDTTLSNVAADFNFVSKSNYHAVTVDSLHRSVGDPGGWDNFAWWETHGINGGNPLFVSEASDNYHLTATSPLIGVATNLNSLFLKDFDGVNRGSSWDIGAFEFVPVVPTTMNAVRAHIGIIIPAQ